MKSERLSWIDANKGVAIIIVVVYHVTLGLHDAGLLNTSRFLDYFWVYATATSTPIFFILSGFFIERSVDKTGHVGYFKTCLHYVLYPYLLWSLIQWASKLAFSSYVNTTPQLDLSFLLFNPLGQFWFLHSLFLSQILYILIHKYYNKNYTVLAVFFMSVSFLFYLNETFSEFLRAFSFILLGAEAKRINIQTKIMTHYWILPSLIVLLIAGPIYLLVMIPLGFQNSSNFLGGISATILLSAFFLRFGAPSVLHILGKYSMYIFVLHILCLVPFRIILIKLDLVSPFLMISTLTAAGLLMPVLFAAMIETLGLSKYIGIKPVRHILLMNRTRALS